MVRLNALGQSSIEVGDVRIGPEQPYLFAIALYLIVERGKRIPRQALVDLIWPGVRNEKHARQRFRQALLRLREAGLPIAGDKGMLLLEKSAAQTDFDFLMAPDGTRHWESLEFLPHYAPRISDHFLDWVETQRSRVHAVVQRLFLLRMQQARSRCDWAEVDAVAAECLRLDPFNEEAVMAHAECAVMRGSKREALSILDRYMEALGSHVGTIGLPAKILRTRIAERLTDQRYAMVSEKHFVGRESSMSLLQGLLGEAQRGTGSAALVWGEPGIGKSRLVQELTQVATLDGARVVSTKCHPTDAGRPLSAFADLVPVLKTLPGALGCSAQTLSLLQRLTDRNRSEAFPTQEAGDAAFLAATIRRAVFDLVDAVADEGMLIMVIEDVHWLDEPSWTILSAMVEWSTTRPLLILMTSRTAQATESKVADPDRGFHRHHLLPLLDADSGALLDRLAADEANPLPDTMRVWSVEAAEGNPYHLRELVRHWMETQQSFGVPRSLAELIEARLNRLSSLALRVLQLCAAFGKHSSFERLEKATGYANHVLLDAVEELSSAVMLAADKVGLPVKHDLLATAALARLGGPALKLIHRQVAGVLEAEINQKHTAALMWDCAEHWQLAGETAHALKTVRQCASQMHSVGQIREAIELHEKALAICVTPNDQMETLLGMVAGLKASGEWGRLRRVIDTAYNLTGNELESSSCRDRLQLLRIETDWRLGSPSGTSDLGQLITFAGDDSKDPADRVQSAFLGMIFCAEEARVDAAHFFANVVDGIEASTMQPSVVAHLRMIYHADFGDPTLALANAEALLELETQSGEPSALSRAQGNVALLYWRLGMAQKARALLHKKLSFASTHGLNSHATSASGWLAVFALQEDDYESANKWHSLALRYVHAVDEKAMPDILGFIKSRIAIHNGDLEPAREYVSRFSSHVSTFNYRLRQTVLSTRCQIEIASGGEINRANLDTMARDFDENCALGQHDYFALVIYRGLNAVGDPTRAQRLLRNYLARRKEKKPLPPSLAIAVGELEGLNG